MTSMPVKQPLHPQVAALLADLIADLAGVQDAHFVCASIAAHVAKSVGCRAVVGISDSQHEFFDVWIAEPDSELSQQKWTPAQGSFGPIVSADSALELVKLSRPVSEILSSELWMLAQERILAVPLRFNSTQEFSGPTGVLVIIDPKMDCALQEQELDFLTLSMSVYLDRAMLRRQVDRQGVEFTVVSGISQMLASTLDMEQLFQELTETLKRILQVESLSVGLIEAETGDVVFVESLMGVKFDTMPAIRVKSGQGIAGWVSEHGESVIVNDVYADERFYARPDRLSGFRTRSMICIPLQVEERTIGVLQAINRRYGQFTAHDQSLLEAIGSPLAAAIANSRLHADVLSEKRRVETILAGMFEGLLAISGSGQVTRFNDAFLALIGDDTAQLLGRQAVDVVPLATGNLAGLLEDVRLQKEESAQMTADLLRASGGSVPVLISGAPMFDDQEKVSEVILTFSDLSQVREVERMRDDLFHAIAHELRTPLATILMYARLLLEGKAQDEKKAERFLGVIERESDRLQHMVRRMMQLAKQDARELHRSPEPVHLNPLLADMLPPLADRAQQKGLLLRKKIEADLPAVLGDEERFEEIIQNLVENAIKFSPSGTIKVEAYGEDGYLILRVSDQGIGVSSQALPYLFTRFYRAQTAVDRGIAGTGLGLYMVKRSVEQYNGSIDVTSREGEGTAFTISFPFFKS